MAAAYNRFPLLYPDSSTYLFFAKFFKSAGERPVLYGLWLAFGHALIGTYWFGVIAQCLVTALLIRWVMIAHRVRRLDLHYLAVCLGLAAVTGICWQAGQLMADAFTAPLVLSFYLIVFQREKIGEARAGTAELILLFALFVHLSHLYILVLALVTLWGGYRLRGQRLFASPPILMLAAIFAVLPITAGINSALGLGFGYSKNSYAFLVSRLVEDGSVNRFLDNNCDKNIYVLCNERPNLIGKNAADFLWGERGPFRVASDETQAYRKLVWGIFWSEPFRQLAQGGAVFGKQLFRFGSGEAISPWNENAWELKSLAQSSPKELPRFLKSRQQSEDLTGLFFKLNIIYYSFFALAALIALVSLSGYAGAWPEEKPLVLTIGAFLLANAFVCGVFSGAYHRYQSRLAWLPVFAAILILIRWRERRGST